MRRKTMIRYLLVFFIVTLLNGSALFASENNGILLTGGQYSMMISPSVATDKLPLFQSFLDHLPGNWKITVNGEGIIRKATIGRDNCVTGFSSLEQFLSLLCPFASLLGVTDSELKQLKLSDTIDTPAKTIFVCSQYVNSIEVFDACLQLKYNKDGVLIGFDNHLKKTVPVNATIDFFDDSIVLTNTQRGTFIGSRGYVWYSTIGSITLAKICFFAFPMPGYENPVETFCLVDRFGNILFRKVLHVPYRRDRPLSFE